MSAPTDDKEICASPHRPAPVTRGAEERAGRRGRRPLRTHYWWCVGEGLSCPPLCRPIPGHCRARQSGHFLETGLLHPPLAALRRFPLPRATARVAPTGGLQGVRCKDVSPSHGFAVPAPFRQGGLGDGGCGNPFLPPHIYPLLLLSYFPPGCARTIHK